MKRILSLLLAAAMLLAFGGCAEETLGGMTLDEALPALVDGYLNEQYLGVSTTTYLDLTGGTREEGEQRHLDVLDAAARRFASYFRIEYLTDELKAEIVEILDQVYPYSTYTAGAAEKVDGDSYTVAVTVSPINFISLVVDEIRAGALDDFNANFPSIVVKAMDENSYRQYDAMWAREILDLCHAQLENIAVMEEQTLTVQVEKVHNVWGISEDSAAELNELIIYYP